VTYTPLDFGEETTEKDVIDHLEESVIDAYEDALEADFISTDIRSMLEVQLGEAKAAFSQMREKNTETA
jgi:hypothetical protein